MSDLFFKALYETIKTLPKANQEENEILRRRVQAKLEKKLA
jgi:hypothetical protein